MATQTASRKKPSNADILDSATAEFAAKGFDGARMDELAHVIGVNKATLYYRIGDKEALYAAVLKRIFKTKQAHLNTMLETVEEPQQRLHGFAQVLVESEHPAHFGAIMLREIADGGRNLPDDVLPLMGKFLGVLEQIVEEGVQTGVFKRANTFLLHMALVGGCSIYACNGPIRHRIAALLPQGTPASTEIPLHDAAHQIAEMLLGGVRA